MKTTTWKRGMLLAVAMAVGPLACTPRYDDLEIQRVAGHSGARISSSEFSVPEGVVVVFEAKPRAKGGLRDYEAVDQLELLSVDPERARVLAGLRAGTWMIMGVAEGQTRMIVRINGEVHEEIPIVVTRQGVSP